MAKQIETAGIPTAHVCSMVPVAVQVGSNRIIPSVSVLHPTGNAELTPEQEKRVRREIVVKALEALKTKIEEQKVF
jgi:glycine reductase